MVATLLGLYGRTDDELGPPLSSMMAWMALWRFGLKSERFHRRPQATDALKYSTTPPDAISTLPADAPPTR